MDAGFPFPLSINALIPDIYVKPYFITLAREAGI